MAACAGLLFPLTGRRSFPQIQMNHCEDELSDPTVFPASHLPRTAEPPPPQAGIKNVRMKLFLQQKQR